MKSEQKLDEASDKTQFETIIAGLTDGVILLGLDGTIRYANEAALLMHGLERLEEAMSRGYEKACEVLADQRSALNVRTEQNNALKET